MWNKLNTVISYLFIHFTLLYNAEKEYFPRVCYLGVILDHILNWTSHCRVLRGKALRTLTAMKTILRSSLSIKAKLLLYKAFTYAASAWAFIPKTKMSAGLHLIRGYFWYTHIKKMHLNLQIPRLKKFGFEIKCVC